MRRCRFLRFLISIHAPRTGSDVRVAGNEQVVTISIHAPRTGSDDADAVLLEKRLGISIHAPRTGSDIQRVNAKDF